MTPEEYAVHRERCLWLSEHPLTTRDLEPAETRQAMLEEVTVE